MILILLLLLFILYFNAEHFTDIFGFLEDEHKTDWRHLNIPTHSYPNPDLLNQDAYSKSILSNMYWSNEFNEARIEMAKDWDLQHAFKTNKCRTDVLNNM